MSKVREIYIPPTRTEIAGLQKAIAGFGRAITAKPIEAKFCWGCNQKAISNGGYCESCFEAKTNCNHSNWRDAFRAGFVTAILLAIIFIPLLAGMWFWGK
jgi:molybdenum cofactor biosynthesis enzyme MoaA